MARRAIRREIIFWSGHKRIARSREAFDFAFRRQAHRRMIKTRDGKKLKDWFGKAEQSRISSSAGNSLADGEDP